MAKTKKQSLNKKPIVAIVVGIIVTAAVGSVIAFRSDITRFVNGLVLGDNGLKMTYTEDFVSPDNWAPCTTTPKTVTATNSSDEPTIVRVSYYDYWKSRQDSGYLPLKQGGIDVAVINFANENDWTLNEDDGWYYYKEPLQPGQSTSSFMASVTFNCSYNIGSNTLNACDSQGNCTTPINPYANAKYHVEVTIQTTREGADWPPEQVIAEGDPCHSNILYYEIACRTNGPDDNVNFRQSGSSNANGRGVNTRKTTANDANPVYYYRGPVNNNLVIWADYCWRIVRTTSTGGVKLIYSGPIMTNSYSGALYCETNPSKQGVAYARFSNGHLADNTTTPDEAYYMYGDNGENRNSTFKGTAYGWDEEYGGHYDYLAHIGTALIYKDGKYMPAGSVVVGDPVPLLSQQSSYGTIPEETQQTHIYSCDEAQWGYKWGTYEDWCERGAVHLYPSWAFTLYNGELTIEDAFNHMQQNVNDSRAKKEIDSWYAANLTGYTNQLEDTVFCADRRYSGFLRDSVYVNTTGRHYTVYGATANTDSPSVTCPRINDSFTVSSSIGNGALTYPVGMLTADEAFMAGSVWGIANYDSWLSYGGTSHTMTPYYIDGNDNATIFIAGNGGYQILEASIRASEWYAIRPVVSLKPGTRIIRGGDGTYTNPYIIR